MPRAIDHLVLASHSLEQQAAFYTRLGFTVGARNAHSWGTQNHIVQLHGGFLELIGLGEGFSAPPSGEPVARFAGFLAEYLKQREGLAMLALQSRDAEKDQAAFEAAGISAAELFRFGRKATRPDGSPVDVGFALAFARSPHIMDAGFFVCQNLHPENFWNKAQQVHRNGALGIAGAIMVAENPSDHAEFLAPFTGQREMTATSMGLEIDTGGGVLEVLTPLAYIFRTGLAPPRADHTPAFAAYRVAVADVGVARRVLDEAAVVHGSHGAAAVVAPEQGFGVAILFQQQN